MKMFNKYLLEVYMKQINVLTILAFIIAALLLPACTSATVGVDVIKPVHLEPIAGTNLNRVILTEKAAERLDIQTGLVRDEEIDGTQQKVIPYAAVLYDATGQAWAYTNPEPLVFIRQAIVIDHIKGDMAVLSEGPASGMAVVTIGAAELFGSESEFEEE
jgi:hypothetical protein